MQKLLIADCSEDFRLALAQALQADYQVLCCGSGREALSLLCAERPDILVLELILPEMDGLTVLENAAKAGIHPKILAFIPFLTDYILQCVQRFGIGYVMRKPCDLQGTVSRIRDLSQFRAETVPKQDPRDILSQRLLSLSVSAKHNGYHYMTQCILMLLQNPGLSVTKELYPAVAKQFDCEGKHVERSIRSALEAAWKRGDPALWHASFPEETRRPTNAVFLSRMAEELRRME